PGEGVSGGAPGKAQQAPDGERLQAKSQRQDDAPGQLQRQKQPEQRGSELEQAIEGNQGELAGVLSTQGTLQAVGRGKMLRIIDTGREGLSNERQGDRRDAAREEPGGPARLGRP